jgi:hypothetical protein
MLETIERMEAVTKLRLSAQPTPGRATSGAEHLPVLAGCMASRAPLVLHNVRVVGGCCGTTPEHIRQISRMGSGARSVKGSRVWLGWPSTARAAGVGDGCARALRRE